jgi:phosphohistidine phosphatase
LLPDFVISSPAERALTTAQKCCKVMGMGADKIHQDKRIYLAEPEELLAVLADCPQQASRVMLVGHNPGFEELLVYLAQELPPMPVDGKLLPTATLALLLMPDDWSRLKPGQGRLLHLLRAADLGKKFPYPSPHGEELRDRPAYYYTQSAVIPYRINHGELEILIISSSSNRHWGVPKGIADPGHSKQSSAAKEAWEEAGVEGEVDDEPLGHYEYPKWGASCSVTVYPLQVSHQLDEKQWHENHRRRQWVTADKAVKLIRQHELGDMVRRLQQRLGSCD